MNTIKRKTLCASRLLFLVFCVGLVALSVTSCGRLPPEKFWTGDASDTAGIKSLIIYYDTHYDSLEDWRGFFSRFDFDTLIDTVRFSSARTFPGTETDNLEWRIKQAYAPSRLSIDLSREEPIRILLLFTT